MDILKKFAYDKAKTEDGVWVNFDAETSFKIASMNSRRFELKLAELMRPFRNPALRHKLDDPNFALDLRTKAMAEALILDWKGLTNDGQPVPYSPEFAEQILTQSPEVRKWVEAEAEKRENYLLAAKEAATENLKSSP